MTADTRCVLDDNSWNARHLQGSSQAEWKQAHGAAMLLGGRGAELEELMGRSACLLVMEYVPGRALFQAPEPFALGQVLRTAEDLGRRAHDTVGRFPCPWIHLVFEMTAEWIPGRDIAIV